MSEDSNDKYLNYVYWEKFDDTAKDELGQMAKMLWMVVAVIALIVIAVAPSEIMKFFEAVITPNGLIGGIITTCLCCYFKLGRRWLIYWARYWR